MKNYLTNALNLKALLLNILGLLHRTTVNFISFGDAGEGGEDLFCFSSEAPDCLCGGWLYTSASLASKHRHLALCSVL